METPIFDFYPAKTKAIGLVSIPHAGEIIPTEFTPYLSGDLKAYSRDVDYKTNELLGVEDLNKEGIHVIVSNIQRICVDLNRSREIAVFAWPNNSFGENILKTSPSEEIKEQFLQKYYDPYYEVLKTTIEGLERETQKTVPVIDFHSMPSHPTAYHLSVTPDQPSERPTFCLSNLNGLSSTKDFIHYYKRILEREYENVSLNYPYYGGYLTQYINTFDTMNFQIEVRRNLYMDEQSRSLIPSHHKVKEVSTKGIIELFKHFSA